LLTAHRTDLIAARVRMLNRLRDVLTGIFPALERAFGYADHKGALILLAGYQTPAAIRRRGHARLTAWLTSRNVRNPDSVAATALQAAQAQHATLPGQDVAAGIVADITKQILALDDRLKHIDQQIRQTFRTHPQAHIIESLGPAWVPSWEPSSSLQQAIWPPSPTQAIWPPRPAWCPFPGTPAAAPATSTGPSATADASAGSSICPPRPASSVKAPTVTTT
jgi:hypothetical protein